MFTVGQMIAKLDALVTRDLTTLYADAVEDTKDIYLEQLREQMKDGKRKDQSNITPLYSEAYKKQKQRLGLESSHVTLYKTGHYYANLFMDVREKTYLVDSLSEQSPYLSAKYNGNSNILSIGGPYRQIYLQALSKRLKQVFGDNF